MHKTVFLFQGDSGINGYPGIPGEKVYVVIVFLCPFYSAATLNYNEQEISHSLCGWGGRETDLSKILIMIEILVAFT